MNFQPPEYDDPRDDEQRFIDGERAAFEKDAEPMGFDLTRMSVGVPEPWSEYKDEATGHRWGGWLAGVEHARAVLALAPGLSGWQEIASDEDAWRLLDAAAKQADQWAEAQSFEPTNEQCAGRQLRYIMDELAQAGLIAAPGIAPHQPQPEGCSRDSKCCPRNEGNGCECDPLNKAGGAA